LFLNLTVIYASAQNRRFQKGKGGITLNFEPKPGTVKALLIPITSNYIAV